MEKRKRSFLTGKSGRVVYPSLVTGLSVPEAYFDRANVENYNDNNLIFIFAFSTISHCFPVFIFSMASVPSGVIPMISVATPIVL